MHIVFGFLLSLTALFLILIVLIQRGRGGGLAGAFGGMGGQSAFGTKAGDTFTWITFGVFVFWILLCIAAVKFMSSTSHTNQLTGGSNSVPAGGPGKGETLEPAPGKGGPTGTTPAVPAPTKSGESKSSTP